MAGNLSAAVCPIGHAGIDDSGSLNSSGHGDGRPRQRQIVGLTGAPGGTGASLISDWPLEIFRQKIPDLGPPLAIQETGQGRNRVRHLPKMGT